MDYYEYIKSAAWQIKRLERLKIDGNKCVICKGEDNLQVHHIHYESLGHENVLTDLITVCANEHKFLDSIERFRRYSLRQRKPKVIKETTKKRDDISYGMENSTLSIEVTLSTANAQRANRGSAKPLFKGNETNIRETAENRRRLRRNGAD